MIKTTKGKRSAPTRDSPPKKLKIDEKRGLAPKYDSASKKKEKETIQKKKTPTVVIQEPTPNPLITPSKISRAEVKNMSPEEKMECLKMRKIMPTRAVHWKTLEELGIDKDVKGLVEQVDWIEFFAIAEPVYYDLTKEFLSTVQIHEGGDEMSISFMMDGEERSLTLTQLATRFNLPKGGVRKESDNDKLSYNTIWKRIALDINDPHGFLTAAELALNPNAKPRNEYKSSASKVSSILHPAFRFVQKFLCSTMFGRGDSQGTFQEPDMLVTCCMIKGIGIDGAYFLANRFESQANSTVDNIVIGGLITHLARTFEVNLKDVKPDLPVQYMDIPQLIHLKLIERVGDRHSGPIFLRFNNGPFYRLPFDPPLPVSEHENWKPIKLLELLPKKGAPKPLGTVVPSISTTPSTSQAVKSSTQERTTTALIDPLSTLPKFHVSYNCSPKKKMKSLLPEDEQMASFEERLSLMEKIQDDNVKALADNAKHMKRLLQITGKLFEKYEAQEKKNEKFKKNVMRALMNMDVSLEKLDIKGKEKDVVDKTSKTPEVMKDSGTTQMEERQGKRTEVKAFLKSLEDKEKTKDVAGITSSTKAPIKNAAPPPATKLPTRKANVDEDLKIIQTTDTEKLQVVPHVGPKTRSKSRATKTNHTNVEAQEKIKEKVESTKKNEVSQASIVHEKAGVQTTMNMPEEANTEPSKEVAKSYAPEATTPKEIVIEEVVVETPQSTNDIAAKKVKEVVQEAPPDSSVTVTVETSQPTDIALEYIGQVLVELIVDSAQEMDADTTIKKCEKSQVAPMPENDKVDDMAATNEMNKDAKLPKDTT